MSELKAPLIAYSEQCAFSGDSHAWQVTSELKAPLIAYSEQCAFSGDSHAWQVMSELKAPLIVYSYVSISVTTDPGQNEVLSLKRARSFAHIDRTGKKRLSLAPHAL
jgi:hypothetical protein